MATLRITLAALILPALLPVAAGANPHTACTDCPTPPPCAADGACRPKRATWGYYQGAWSRWPSDYDQAEADERAIESVPGILVPEKEVEAEAAPAPPQSEPEPPRPPQDAPPEDNGGPLDLPSLPPLPGLDGVPEPRDPGAPAPGDDDPPPGLPPLPGFEGPPGIGPPPTGGRAPGQTRRRGAPLHDAPPALPASFARRLPPSAGPTRADYTGDAGGRREPVSPAYYWSPAVE